MMKYYSSPDKNHEVSRQDFVQAVINGWAAVVDNGPAIIITKTKEYTIQWIGGLMFSGHDPSIVIQNAEQAARSLAQNHMPIIRGG